MRVAMKSGARHVIQESLQQSFQVECRVSLLTYLPEVKFVLVFLDTGQITFIKLLSTMTCGVVSQTDMHLNHF